MDLYEAMRTTFAAREFTDAPVNDTVLHHILENARFAPSGGNRQPWRIIVVRSPETRARFVKWVEPTMQRYVAQMVAGEAPFNTIHPSKVDDAALAKIPPPTAMLETMLGAPVLLLVCADLSVLAAFDADLDRVGIIGGASVYPFAWNVLLAARAEGLAGTITTFLAPAEALVREHLGIPEHIVPAALVPIGHPVKQLTRLRRKSVEEITALERWDGEPLGAG